MSYKETDEFISPEIVNESLYEITRNSFPFTTVTAVLLESSIKVNAVGLKEVFVEVVIFE